MRRFLSENVAFRRWLFLGYWLVMFLGTHTPHIERIGPDSLFDIPNFDKVAHFGMFLGWMLLSWWLLCGRPMKPSGRALVGLFVAGALYAAFDEITQAYVERTPSIADYAADLAGMAFAILLIRYGRRFAAARSTR
jgi:hypothetical protein